MAPNVKDRPVLRTRRRSGGRPCYWSGLGAAFWLVIVAIPLYFLVARSTPSR